MGETQTDAGTSQSFGAQRRTQDTIDHIFTFQTYSEARDNLEKLTKQVMLRKDLTQNDIYIQTREKCIDVYRDNSQITKGWLWDTFHSHKTKLLSVKIKPCVSLRKYMKQDLLTYDAVIDQLQEKFKKTEKI